MSTLERLKVIAHGLAVQFGPSCEVLIHDLQARYRYITCIYRKWYHN